MIDISAYIARPGRPIGSEHNQLQYLLIDIKGVYHSIVRVKLYMAIRKFDISTNKIICKTDNSRWVVDTCNIPKTIAR